MMLASLCGGTQPLSFIRWG